MTYLIKFKFFSFASLLSILKGLLLKTKFPFQSETGARPKTTRPSIRFEQLDGNAESASDECDEVKDPSEVESEKSKKMTQKRKSLKIGSQLDGPNDSSDSDAEDLVIEYYGLSQSSFLTFFFNW
jgi:hypothetical protein